MTSIVIRAAVRADHARLAAVWWEGWLSTGIAAPGGQDAASLRARFAQEVAGGWQLEAAERGGALVELLALKGDALDQLFVDPAAHGTGVGTALLGRAKALRPGGFHFHTHADNARARRFYEREGCPLVSLDAHPRYGYPVATYRWP